MVRCVPKSIATSSLESKAVITVPGAMCGRSVTIAGRSWRTQRPRQFRSVLCDDPADRVEIGIQVPFLGGGQADAAEHAIVTEDGRRDPARAGQLLTFGDGVALVAYQGKPA